MNTSTSLIVDGKSVKRGETLHTKIGDSPVAVGWHLVNDERVRVIIDRDIFADPTTVYAAGKCEWNDDMTPYEFLALSPSWNCSMAHAAAALGTRGRFVQVMIGGAGGTSGARLLLTHQGIIYAPPLGLAIIRVPHDQLAELRLWAAGKWEIMFGINTDIRHPGMHIFHLMFANKFTLDSLRSKPVEACISYLVLLSVLVFMFAMGYAVGRTR